MQSQSSQQSLSSQLCFKQTQDSLMQDSSTKYQTSIEFSKKKSIQSQPQMTSISSFHQSLKQKQRKEANPQLEALNQILEQKKKDKNNAIDVPPDIAAIVVERYLLPMFENDNRNVLNKNRNKMTGKNESFQVKKQKVSQDLDEQELNKNQLITSYKNFQLPMKKMMDFEGTVYAELKLSDKLYKELQSVRLQLDETAKKLKETIQNTSQLYVQLEALKNEGLQSQINEKAMKNQLEFYIKQINIQSYTQEQFQQQIFKFKELYGESERQRFDLSELLKQEKAINDKLNNKNIENEHSITILRTENEIIGERLRYLFQSLNLIVDKKCLEDKLYLELKNLFKSSIQFSTFLTNQKNNIVELQKSKDYYVEEANQQARQIQEIVANRDKIRIMAQNKIMDLVKDNSNYGNQNITLTSQNNELKQKNKTMNDELDKLRKKMHSLKQRYKMFGDQETKSCKNCQQEYLESQNLNWSCRTHKSPWQGEIYWCCGKTNEKAPGCKTSKHESKDDEDELDQAEKDQLEKMQNRNVYCPNCKELGHNPLDCERDPNIRQNKIMQEELQRVEGLQKQKRKQNKGLNNQTERQYLMQLLQNKFSQQWKLDQQMAFTYPYQIEEGWDYSSLVDPSQ